MIYDMTVWIWSGLAGGNHYHKIAIRISRLVLQNFALLGCFYPFLSFFFLLTLSGWVVIAVCDSVSVQGPISLKIFPTEFKFDGNLILLLPKF